MSGQINDQDKEAKLKEFFERARKGVVRHLNDQGGALSLEELHEYSLNKFFIQHQRFSQLMESLVEEKLIDYDQTADRAAVTEKGKEFIKGVSL